MSKRTLTIAIVAISMIGLAILGYFVSSKMSESKVEGEMIIRTGTVSSVVDGDTCWVTQANGEKIKVRFTGVNTPELDGDEAESAQAAKKFTETKLLGEKVWLMSESDAEYDKYGRLLAYVWLIDPERIEDHEAAIIDNTINGLLIFRGYAEPMTIEPNTTFASKFEKAYEDANGKASTNPAFASIGSSQGDALAE